MGSVLKALDADCAASGLLVLKVVPIASRRRFALEDYNKGPLAVQSYLGVLRYTSTSVDLQDAHQVGFQIHLIRQCAM